MQGLCVIVSNLKPEKLAGHESNGLLLFVKKMDENEFELLRPNGGADLGERCSLEDSYERDKPIVDVNKKEE